MKKLMILAAVLVLIPLPALAIYGGEVIDFQIERCEYLTVNITNSSFGEWEAYPDCREEGNGSFYCNCTDNFTLFLTPKPNSIGNFDIKIDSFYGEPTTTTTTQTYYYSGYSPPSCKKESYTCSVFQECCDGLECDSNICIKEVTNTTTTTTTTLPETTTTTIPPTTTTTLPLTTTTTLPEEPQGFDPIWIILLFAIGLPISIVVAFLYARR